MSFGCRRCIGVRDPGRNQTEASLGLGNVRYQEEVSPPAPALSTGRGAPVYGHGFPR